MSVTNRIKVLIVDDSAIVRKLLSDALSATPDIEVVGTAPDPVIAREKIERLKPDVLTLDIEMPRMDGLTFLRDLMQRQPMPVIMISSLAQRSCSIAMQALEIGAVEVMAKPDGPFSVGDLLVGLPQKVRSAASARLRRSARDTGSAKRPTFLASAQGDSRDVIAIGASTGGTEALRDVLTTLPENSPPILVVQHIPPVFSAAFADRLNGICRIRVREAADGDHVEAGHALIAPGNQHMTVHRTGGKLHVSIRTGPRVCYQRPSVDVLFQSMAEAVGKDGVGVLLTGMGADGAQGLLRMKRSGARTIVQNESTCVVYGMPREAVKLGAADQVLPLQSIAHAMLQSRVPACAMFPG